MKEKEKGISIEIQKEDSNRELVQKEEKRKRKEGQCTMRKKWR